MARDMNDRVAEYRDLVESLARKLVGRNEAEFDDLVQEGLIMVRQTLDRGITPAASQIENRMNDWVRLLGTQIGRGRGKTGEAIEYETLLSIEPLMEAEERDDLTSSGWRQVDTGRTSDLIPLPGHDPLA